ncbi:MAG TPA: hypothetical protein GXX36_06765 [Clostridiaceae bacterium]|nr:hypothetical protein [Clostridiaceae bacterium]
MSFVVTSVFFLILIVALLACLVIFSLRKGTSGIKIILFGLNLTLLGGILVVDPNSNLRGIEYLIALLGLIISAVGLGKSD